MVRSALSALFGASVAHAIVLGHPLSGSLGHQWQARQTSEACQQLDSKFPNQVFFPNSSTYTTENTDYYASSVILSPWCVFTPNSSQDVAGGVSIVVASNTSFAVRGGGHMPIAGAADTNNGVLFAMDGLNKVNLTTFNGTNVAIVESGNRWGVVYGILEAEGVVVAGGRYSPVGTGGLPLGGGLDYFHSVRGWTADTIVNYEAVTANGTIIEVNAGTYPDLFWALKGGQNNFAIVTKYYMKTYPLQQVWAGFVDNAESENDQLIEAVATFGNNQTGGSLDPKAAIDASLFYSSTDGSITGVTNVFYNGTGPAAAVANFTNIPATTNTVSNRNYTSFVNETAIFGKSPLRSLWVALSVKSTAEAVRLAGQVYLDAISQQNSTLMSIPNGTFTCTWQPLTVAGVEAARASGGDAIDLDPADGGAMLMMYTGEYAGAQNDGFVEGFLKNITNTLETQAKAQDLYYPFIFLNDAGGWQQNLFSLYGHGKSLPRLREIARKYDPSGVFQTLLAGAWKVF